MAIFLNIIRTHLRGYCTNKKLLRLVGGVGNHEPAGDLGVDVLFGGNRNFVLEFVGFELFDFFEAGVLDFARSSEFELDNALFDSNGGKRKIVGVGGFGSSFFGGDSLEFFDLFRELLG